jgi:hypothetical protein
VPLIKQKNGPTFAPCNIKGTLYLTESQYGTDSPYSCVLDYANATRLASLNGTHMHDPTNLALIARVLILYYNIKIIIFYVKNIIIFIIINIINKIFTKLKKFLILKNNQKFNLKCKIKNYY